MQPLYTDNEILFFVLVPFVGVAIISLGGLPCKSIDDLKKILAGAKERGEAAMLEAFVSNGAKLSDSSLLSGGSQTTKKRDRRTQDSPRVQSVPKKRKMSTSDASPPPEKGASLKEYAKVFETCKPLGFHCISESGSGAAPVCKIDSICPDGQAKGDQRIQVDTVIISVAIGDEKHEVHGDIEKLKELYLRARADKSTIVISFINSFVTDKSVAEGGRPTYWDGQRWKPNCAGWPGGSELLESSPPKWPSLRRALAPLSTIQQATDQQAGSQKTNETQMPSEAVVELQSEWVERVSNITPTASLPSKPILKKENSSPKKKKRVKLSINPVSETRKYFVDAETNHFLVLSTDEGAQTLLHPDEAPSPKMSPQDALRDSLLHGSFMDTMALILSGTAEDLAKKTLFEVSPLDEMKEAVKKKLHSVEKEVCVLIPVNGYVCFALSDVS